jgi:hypothetical protein
VLWFGADRAGGTSFQENEMAIKRKTAKAAKTTTKKRATVKDLAPKDANAVKGGLLRKKLYE